MPMVSVIVPVYNGAEFLEACVDSILAQDYRDFEIIVVDDASTDGTAALCETLCARGGEIPVRVHRHEKNRGPAGARNTGISLARGKYIMFVDADDLILWNGLSALVETAERYHAEVVSADGYLRANATNVQMLQSDSGADFETRAGSRMVSAPECLPQDAGARISLCVHYEMLVFAWNRLYLRSFLLENEIVMPDGFWIGEDLLFHLVCVLSAKTYIRIPDFFYVYCQSAASLVHRPKPPEWVGYLAKSAVLGVRYLREKLAPLPFFQEHPASLDTVIQLFLENFKHEHIAKGKFYADYKASPEVDAAVLDAFLPLFGEDAYFVKYLFHVMNIHFAEASALVDEKAALKAELERLKSTP